MSNSSKKFGINEIINPGDKKIRMVGVKENFLDTFYSFLKKNGINEVFITSGYRPESKGSFHAIGQALDLHYVKGNGKYHHFSEKGDANKKLYSKSKDIEFYNLVKNQLGKKLYQYISPSIIHLSDGFNRYNNKTGELDSQHLNHLHIAIDIDRTGSYSDTPKSKIKTKNKSDNSILIPVAIAGIAGGYYLWKQKQEE